MASYIPSTQAQRQEMLRTVGVADYRDLYRDVPAQMYLDKGLDIPEGLSEPEVSRKMTAMAGKNRIFSTVLRGAGAYDHYIPSIVKYIPAKEEFLTAYTPYQAEMSQGILQSIFEYQTMICRLTGMDVSNASVYDGATAAAEAAAMCRDRKRKVTLISAAAHPDTIATVRTYCYGTGDALVVIPEKDGKTDLDALKEMLTPEVSGVYIQQPNFYGQFEEAEAIGQLVHEAGAMYIMGCNPIALAITKTPAACGADIAVGEGQPLGMPLSYGGPYLGFMATTAKHVRKLPGRIVGQTEDNRGNRVFVLSLQARLKGTFDPAFDRLCMHEFVLDLSKYKKETGVSALDVAKTLIDYGMHPPTMYFPLIVHEALMLEPTETESMETLDWAADVLRELYALGFEDPEYMHGSPHNAPIGRPDEVKAARSPILKFEE